MALLVVKYVMIIKNPRPDIDIIIIVRYPNEVKIDEYSNQQVTAMTNSVNNSLSLSMSHRNSHSLSFLPKFRRRPPATSYRCG